LEGVQDIWNNFHFWHFDQISMDFKEKFKFISRHFEFDLDSNKLRDSDGNLNFIDSYGVNYMIRNMWCYNTHPLKRNLALRL
jgi:hypothetical protein